MNFLGNEYSEKLAGIWNQISEPKPSVKEYTPIATGMDPRFAGQHSYDEANGDSVLVVPGVAHEYTIAHELMHVALRREDYPHFTCRALGLLFDTVKRTTGQLESAAIHPVLNQRLASRGIELPPEHIASYVQKTETTIRNDREAIQELPHELPYWALLFTEMTMWRVIPQDELRKTLDLPAAWELADQLLRIANGLERGSPERCREFAVQAVRAIDECLNVKHRQPANLFMNRIMFPPPPFLAASDSMANLILEVNTPKKNTISGQYELEVVRTSDGTVCWAQPFSTQKEAGAAYALAASSLRLGCKDFADFCERRFGTVQVR